MADTDLYYQDGYNVPRNRLVEAYRNALADWEKSLYSPERAQEVRDYPLAAPGWMIGNMLQKIAAAPLPWLEASYLAQKGVSPQNGPLPAGITPADVLSPPVTATGLTSLLGGLERNAVASFGSRLHKAHDHKAVEKADDMWQRGFSSPDIAKETGWHWDQRRGDFGQYIPTTDWELKAKLAPGMTVSGPLGDLLHAPHTFRAFPDLATTDTVLALGPKVGGFFMPGRGPGGYFPEQVQATAPTLPDLMQVLRHEVAGHGVDYLSWPGWIMNPANRDAPLLPRTTHGMQVARALTSEDINKALARARYTQKPIEASARMAEYAPAYDNALRAQSMLYPQIDAYRSPWPLSPEMSATRWGIEPIP